MRARLLRRLVVFLGALALAGGLWPARVAGQTPFVPYFGKNLPRYVTFDWHIYTTDHFDIFFYPDLEPHLERIAGYAESAYQRISADLQHELPGRVPLVLYKTQSEFQLQNIAGGELPEGVLAFAEPERNRMVLPIDEPPDQLYRLITHELTHVFEFDIIPRGILGADQPLWVDEGLANYMAGYWNVLDLMQVRDAALTDSIPPMSNFQAAPLSGRLPYSLGHATFEFIESRWGKEGVRQFLFELRRGVVGGGDSAYEEALNLSPDEFDDEFDRYLKERFRPFRDKERPADYGRDLAPDPNQSRFPVVLSIEPSPSGELIAAAMGNRRDQELDIVLISAADGQIIRNLTPGFDKDRGFEYISTSGGLRGNLVPWMAWSPVGDRLAYFARTEKDKTLVIQNVVSGRTEQRLLLSSVDGPESPSFSPDGRTVAFAAIREGVTDIFTIDLQTGSVTNVTGDTFAEYAPSFSPDGRQLVYSARVGGNDKIFVLDRTTRAARQVTFGTHDDIAPRFVDDTTLIFTSTAMDPNNPVLPNVARNGAIPNVWTLDLESGTLRQWTDTATGIVSPVPLGSGPDGAMAFVTYYKGINGIHTLAATDSIVEVPSSDFGSPGPIIDFTPPFSHTLVPDNIHKKGAFERMSLAARPPVGLGVTSGGDFYGNTEVTFTDILGDKEISFYAQSVSQYRTTALTYVNLERRLQYALQGFTQDRFYYGTNQAFFDLVDRGVPIDRDDAEAVQSTRGVTAFGIYPFNRYARLELYGGYVHLEERYTNDALQAAVEQAQLDRLGAPLFRNGSSMPLGITFVQETTIFRDFGPVAGSTVRLSFDSSPDFGDDWLSRRTVDLDARYYMRLAANGVLAMRFHGVQSWGRNPDFFFFGGNSEMRGYDYLEFIGHKGFFANAELRFPLIEAMLTPIGVLGGLRGVGFVNLGGASLNDQQFQLFSNSSTTFRPTIGYQTSALGLPVPILGPELPVSGLRLVDGRASYGVGLQSFLLGFPMHFDWSWRTLLNRDWEDLVFLASALAEDPSGNTRGSDVFRRRQFSFWIGFDF